ncbi:hydrogenase expression/formation protein HypE [Elusimicrobiota bacterium]
MRKTKNILLAHGSGGRLTHELINKIIVPKFSNKALNSLDDAAEISNKKGNIAFTTDSFVVDPIFFDNGDIGKLSICGTVNDLAMKGAEPIAISIAAIIEEGLGLKILEKIIDSAAKTARQAGVKIVTGDTKVVEKGKADKIFLTTSGIGIINKKTKLSGSFAKNGDAVIINGTIGDHGISVLAARNDFKLKTKIKSDCAPLNGIVSRLLKSTENIHVLRDPTRGGIATTLNEIAKASNVGIIISEIDLPIRNNVKTACRILGLDPLYVANEGKFIACLPGNNASKALNILRKHPYGKNSKEIGKVVKYPKGVWVKTKAGGLRPVVMLEGNQLPRIC